MITGIFKNEIRRKRSALVIELFFLWFYLLYLWVDLDRDSLCNPGWLAIPNLQVSASLVA